MDSPDTSQQATGSQHSLVEEDDDGQEPLATAPTSTKAPKIAVIGKLSTYLVAEVGEDSVCLVSTRQVAILPLLM